MRPVIVCLGWIFTIAGLVSPAIAQSCAHLPSPFAVSLPGDLERVAFGKDCEHLYVTNARANRVDIVSLRTGRPTGRIPVGARPVGLDISADGGTLYVVNAFDSSVSLISTATHSVVGNIAIPRQPPGEGPTMIAAAANGKVFLAGSAKVWEVSPDGSLTLRKAIAWPTALTPSANRAFIAVTGGEQGRGGGTLRYLSRYSAFEDSFLPTAEIGPGEGIGDFVIDDTGTAGFLSNGATVLDGGLKVEGRISLCCDLGGTAISPNGRYGYIVSGGSIDVVDIQARRRLGTLGTGDTIGLARDHRRIGRLTMSPSGDLIAAITDHGLSLIRPEVPIQRDLPTAGRVGDCTAQLPSPLTIPIAGSITDVVIDDACEYVYAANRARNRVDVIELMTQEIVASIPVGPGPTGLDTSADGKSLIVANGAGNSVSIVDITRRAETHRINLGGVIGGPETVAAAANGYVFVRGTGVHRLDPNSSPPYAASGYPIAAKKMARSADRSVIAFVVGSGSADEIYRYESATDTTRRFHRVTEGAIENIGLDGTGARTVFNTSSPTAYLWMMNASAVLEGFVATLAGPADFVFEPAGPLVYVFRGNQFSTFNYQTRRSVGSAMLGDSEAGTRNMAVSRDGTLLAAATESGITFYRPKNRTSQQPVYLVGFSGANTDKQSQLTVYNLGAGSPLTFEVTLSDLTTGRQVARWTSPTLDSFRSQRFSIDTIEREGGAGPDKPQRYLIKVQPSANIRGTASLLVWDRASRSYSNLSACDAALAAPSGILLNVPSSTHEGSDTQSTVVVVNGSPGVESISLQLADPATREVLGRTARLQLKPGTGRTFTIAALENLANVSPDGRAAYQVRAVNSSTAILHHLLLNHATDSITDMSSTCALPRQVVPN